MRLIAVSSSLLFFLVACTGEPSPEIPAPAPTVPNRAPPTTTPPSSEDTAPSTTTTPMPGSTATGTAPTTPADDIPDTVMEKKEGAALPLDLDDPAAKAICATPASAGGTLKSPSAAAAEMQVSVEAAMSDDADGSSHLDLNVYYPTTIGDDETLGRYRADTYVTMSFRAPAKFEVGSYPNVDGKESQTSFGCYKSGTQTLTAYNPPGPLFPKWNLTITSASATLIEGKIERMLDGKTTRWDFSAPISNATIARMTSVCCLGE